MSGTPLRAFMHEEEALLCCSQVPCSRKVCLRFTWQTRPQPSGLSGTHQSGGLLVVYSPTGAPWSARLLPAPDLKLAPRKWKRGLAARASLPGAREPGDWSSVK